ncbi:hypothetical protein LCGC14_0526450 [marine sediment metagenome]|uniref:Uncharacterized protein n=1 Tax=marine sediment metagenome TaxID=412755 RepID=A0A0F9RX62_9ZZZZ
MGISIFGSSCSCSPSTTIIEKVVEKVKEVIKPNPDPTNFQILKTHWAGDYLAAEVFYPDCTNYEGRKILVYNSNKRKIYKAKFLDPHFCEGDHISPIARFEPTGFGWDMALMLIDQLADISDTNN